MEDVEELSEVMKIMEKTVPTLISGIIEGVYNIENTELLAESTAGFYKELVNAGMNKEQAFELTREFMKGRDLGTLIEGLIR